MGGGEDVPVRDEELRGRERERDGVTAGRREGGGGGLG